MAEALHPGGRIGILGGGQLGRMLAMAAARLGLRAHIFDPDPACPAAQVAASATAAAFEDESALAAFAAAVDVITFEFENIPEAALATLAAARPVRPDATALAVSQDRLVEKRFLRDLGLATAPFAPVSGPADIAAAIAACGLPAILKTRRFGYDGKGQARVTDAAELSAAVDTLAGTPAILEGLIGFEAEVSVIAARGLDGAVAAFEPGRNRHEGGILRDTRVPADLPVPVLAEAAAAAARILTALDYVGVLGVEFFVADARLLVNEIAPRVHNSGHWTQAGCATDQFEQHIRAVAGWPLGDPTRFADVRMLNLIGEDATDWRALAGRPGAQLHLYGKTAIRPGRKMGHVNLVRPLGRGAA